MTRAVKVPEAPDRGLARQAYDLLDVAARILGPDLLQSCVGDIPRALVDARCRLSGALASGRLPDSDIGDACHVLVGIEELEEQYAECAAARRAGELRAVHTAATALHGLSTVDMVQSVPEVICSQLPFSRAMISAISGSAWRPQRLFVDPEFQDSPFDFTDFVDCAEFSLVDAPLETELVRRRVPALVLAPLQDDRTLKELVVAAHCSAYTAVPLVSRGKAIGLIHADRACGDDRLDPDDRDRLDAFATFFALIYEQAVLRERISAQRTRLAASFDATDAQLDRIEKVEVGLRRRQPDGPAAHSRTLVADVPPAGIPAILTVREREILSHIATGATNSQIARALVIAEGTVKSHVKHILKKLCVPTRAAAAALYSHRSR
ncbi:helix-turn-helix transcriptional regulator [Rhodococcus zopfii]|uniref:Helix-turn-helix transcriptional regulator n=1 Tax=Rhodococcus zopfii TaxID=43772 RepID=A0ABU3WTM4_9NOCA|nr:helix-turn-helix transcriptional regulator [Rhodococcus zopfii]